MVTKQVPVSAYRRITKRGAIERVRGLLLLAGGRLYFFRPCLCETGQGFPELHIQEEGPLRFRGLAHAVSAFQGIGPSIWDRSALWRWPLSRSRRFRRNVISFR
jgi:hypothetical protein